MEPPSIIADGLAITCDSRRRAGRCSLLVRDGRIKEVSESAQVLISLYPNATVTNASDKLIIPGFVNVHAHAESVLLGRLTQGRHYLAWRQDLRVREAAAALADPAATEDLKALATAAYFDHLRCGTTCVGEFPLAADGRGLAAMQQGAERAGVKAVLTLQTWDHIVHAREHETGRHRYALSVGREEDYTVYSISNMVRVAHEFACPLVAQIMELREDADAVRRNFQKSTVAVLRDFAALTAETLLVHMNYGTAADLRLAAEAGSSVALCARAAATKRTGYPLLRSLTQSAAALCLGTDWADADMLAEMRFLRQLPLLFSGMPSFTPEELLLMATVNGARALGMGTEVGSIETGKKADLVFFTLPAFRLPLPPEAASADTLAAYLVDHLTVQDISAVMTEGKLQVLNGEIRSMPADVLAGTVRRLEAKFVRVEAAETPPSPFGREETQTRHRVIPFVPPENPPELEGFEEGFTIVEKPEPPVEKPQPSGEEPDPPAEKPDAPVPAPASAPKAPALKVVRQEPATKPELSKNVRRVFGDDDDPGIQ